MANNYTIDFTDQNNNRSFQLTAYTTNGPEHPTSDTLDSKAGAAATSLLLHGKGSPDYGERIQEDMIHLLEHFAGAIEPAYPIGGQMWLDRSSSPFVLRVFNTRKHVILVNAPPNSTLLNFFTIAGDETSRITVGSRVRITNVDGVGATTDDQQEFLVSSSALDTNSNTVIDILPIPTAPITGWYVGGWEYVIQNNTGLYEDLPANGNTVTGLRLPVAPSEAATKGYIDTLLVSANEFTQLSDVTLTTPSAGSLVVFDGTVWRDQLGEATGYLPTTGGTLTGELLMGSNLVRSVADPISAQDATTKNYVDTIVSGITGGIPTTLGSLTDVGYQGALGINDILQFNGAQWINVTSSAFAAQIGALLTSGGSMSGDLFLNADPTSNLQAATKGYVDSELIAALAASGDGFVNGGFFNVLSQELTLTRSNGLSHIVVNGFSNGVTTDAVTYRIPDPTTQQGMDDLYWEQSFYEDSAYPDITLDKLMNETSKTIGNLMSPPQRAVVLASGVADYDIGFGGTFGDLNLAYVPNYHNLSVFVNGVKYYADEFGYLEVNGISANVNIATDTDQLWPGMPTGLNPGLSYEFRVRLNAGTISDTGELPIFVNGGNAETLGDLFEQILAFVDNADSNFNGQSPDRIPPMGVIMANGRLTFYSSFPGAGSSVLLLDGGSSGNPGLFGSLIGGTDNAGRTYTYNIDPNTLNDGRKNDGIGNNPPPPRTWGYREVGRPGRGSTKIVFTSGAEPTILSPIELSVDNIPFYDRNLQP